MSLKIIKNYSQIFFNNVLKKLLDQDGFELFSKHFLLVSPVGIEIILIVQ